ncbi:MAG TPA: nucleoside 2-deoxyribosyltransferase [Chloroflexia bacterium]|nr:nucleoside 2-deoxyribosyltransferase [Chloroflexia bacterium]
MTNIYIAGPLFNTHERWYLERICASLEDSGFQTFLPHRDIGLLDPNSPTERERIFQADVEALGRCDACVALLTGQDQDSGTSAELGYFFAQGKPCFGITDDFRGVNNMIWGICDYGRTIVPSIEELLRLVTLRLNPTS